MAKRRTSGEGTIYKTERGKYRAQIVINGRRKSKTADTAKECRTWLAEQRDYIDKGKVSAYSSRPLNELIDNWLISTRATVRPLTYHHYTNRLDRHIRPALGAMSVESITPTVIQAVIDDYMRNGLWSDHTRRAFANLRSVLRRADMIGYIAFNPMDRVDMPTSASAPNKQKIDVWDADEVREYTHAIDDLGIRQGNSLKFAVGTGVRMGELLGLRWRDVDLESGRVKITNQSVPVRGSQKPGLGPLKNEASRRTLTIGSYLLTVLRSQCDMIRAEIALVGDHWIDHDLVFPNRTGFVYSRTQTREAHEKAIEASGLKRIRFHDLRHTAISLMLQQNVPIAEVSRYAGHANVGVTLRVYSHFIPQRESNAAVVMDKVFG